MASFDGRLRRLEQEHRAERWCRCVFDPEQQRAETLAAIDTGEPTPDVCADCGGARISIQYVPWDRLPWHMGARAAERGRGIDIDIDQEAG